MLDDPSIKQYIVETLEEWSIPTATVTLVDLDKGLNETRGFKMDSVEDIVDQDTVWSVCSNSKLFTVVALAVIVEEGKIKRTDKLCDLVPGLHLKDAYANETLTLEDALAHATGIPA